MSSEDATILSAYLDGQLDFDQQQQVDSALVASARFAEDLRALTTVRDLVAGLPRDAGADVTPEVMRRIRGLSRSQPRFTARHVWAVRARRMAIGAGTLSAAAGILLMATVMFTPRFANRRAQMIPRPVTDNTITDSGPGTDSTSTRDQAINLAFNSGPSSTGAADTHSKAIDAQPPVAAQHGSATVVLDASSGHGDLELSRRMLDNPADRRLFLIKNGADGKAEQQVASVVERTSRLGFFKITVSQGIVIDPRHPDEATVFALLVSPKELGRLRAQLNEAMPDVLEEKHADAGIVTQLADIGQVQQFAPVPAAETATPAEALALRTHVGAVDNGAPAAGPATERVSTRPTEEQYRSGPVPPPAGVRSNSGSEREPGAEVVAAEPGSRMVDSPAPSRAHVSDPLTAAKLAPAKPTPAARVPDTARSDEMILVFVWVSKSRPG
jgi:hypothetical protein